MDFIWLNIFSVLLVFILAIVSPGPNFILVVNRSLTFSRKAGVYTAFGVATGTGLFAIAGLLGVILLINSLPYFSNIIHYAGGSYFIYLGLTMIWSCRSEYTQTAAATTDIKLLQPLPAFLTGLVTNLTNPKAWAFYIGLFTLVVDTEFPFWAKLLLVVCIFTISFGWYAALAFLITDHRFQGNLFSAQPYIKSFLGAVLVFFGCKLFLRI